MELIRCYNAADGEWNVLRRELTAGITAMALVPRDLTDIHIALTRVMPGGEFKSHKDGYHHVMYCIGGEGRVMAGGREFAFTPGTVIEIPAGCLHGYSNPGSDIMLMLILNLPATPREEAR